MKNLNKNEKGFGAVELILVIIIVVLIGVVGWLVYKNHHKTTTAAITTTSSTKPATSTSSKATTASTTTVVQIPPLGIEITVPNAIKDLVWSDSGPNGSPGTYSFSTTTLTSLDPNCSDDSQYTPPLGILFKDSGQYPSHPTDVNGVLVKQLSGYYIGSQPLKYPCSQNSATLKIINADYEDFSNSFSSIKPIQ